MRVEEGPLVKAVVDQAKMVLANFGLKSILMMEAFIASHNRSLELYPVAFQAKSMLTL